MICSEDLASKYQGKLNKKMSGPEYEIVTKVVKALTQRRLIVPDTFVGFGPSLPSPLANPLWMLPSCCIYSYNASAMSCVLISKPPLPSNIPLCSPCSPLSLCECSHSGTAAVGCSCKASVGYLYPLERAFMFVPKPAVHIRFEEIAWVNFSRSMGSNRSFDFEISTKLNTTYNFSSIDKSASFLFLFLSPSFFLHLSSFFSPSQPFYGYTWLAEQNPLPQCRS